MRLRTLGQASAAGVTFPGAGTATTGNGASVLVTAAGGALEVAPVRPGEGVGLRPVEIAPSNGLQVQPGEIQPFVPGNDTDADEFELLPPRNGNDAAVPLVNATEAGLRSMLGLDDPESFLAKHGTKVAIGGGVAAAGLILYLAIRR